MARERNVAAGVAYCLRYHPAYRLAREVATAGRLGRLLTARAWFESYLPDWHPWEDYRRSYAARADLGGGVLPTLDHEIDFLNWCLGEPAAVAAEVSTSGTLEMDVPDSARLRVAYPGNVTAEMSLSLCRRQRSRGFELVGDGGTLRFDWSAGILMLATDAAGRQPLWSAEVTRSATLRAQCHVSGPAGGFHPSRATWRRGAGLALGGPLSSPRMPTCRCRSGMLAGQLVWQEAKDGRLATSLGTNTARRCQANVALPQAIDIA